MSYFKIKIYIHSIFKVERKIMILQKGKKDWSRSLWRKKNLSLSPGCNSGLRVSALTSPTLLRTSAVGRGRAFSACEVKWLLGLNPHEVSAPVFPVSRCEMQPSVLQPKILQLITSYGFHNRCFIAQLKNSEVLFLPVTNPFYEWKALYLLLGNTMGFKVNSPTWSNRE